MDRDLVICADWGVDEAARDAQELAPIEPSAWPVTQRLTWTTP